WSSSRTPNFASLPGGHGLETAAPMVRSVELQAKRKAPSWGWAPSNIQPRVRWRRRSNNEIARQLFQRRRCYPQRNVFAPPNLTQGRPFYSRQSPPLRPSSKCPRVDSPDALALIPAVSLRSRTPPRRASFLLGEGTHQSGKHQSRKPNIPRYASPLWETAT